MSDLGTAVETVAASEFSCFAVSLGSFLLGKLSFS